METSHFTGFENRMTYSVFCWKNMKSAAGFMRDRQHKFANGFHCLVRWNPAAVHILFCKTTVWHPIIFMFVSGKFGFTLLLICAGIFGEYIMLRGWFTRFKFVLINSIHMLWFYGGGFENIKISSGTSIYSNNFSSFICICSFRFIFHAYSVQSIMSKGHNVN